MLVLGIESTCDETACAIVRNGREILSNTIASQTDLHDVYGGVVPELACRRHIDVLIPTIRQALEEANVSLEDIDLIAAAYGPGLIGAILIGLNGAKSLSWTLQKPFVGVNHIEAHLYAALMSTPSPPSFPCLGLVVSGGHTSLVEVLDIGQYKLLGQTVDDAVGEAFDKTAKILGLPYPGGPLIEALAKEGDANRFPLKGGRVKGRPLDFSFSGLKTSVLYAAKGPNSSPKDPLTLSEEDKKHLAASFQKAALGDIHKKTLLALGSKTYHGLLIGGGVCHNQELRRLFQGENTGVPVYFPPPGLITDNAAMIAGLGYHVYRNQGPSPLSLQASTRIPFHH